MSQDSCFLVQRQYPSYRQNSSVPTPTSLPIPHKGPLEKFEEWVGADRVVRGIQ